MKRLSLILAANLIAIILSSAIVSAADFGEGAFGCGIFGIGCPEEEPSDDESVSRPSGGTTAPIQFDVKILEIGPNLALGGPFDFSYFVKGVGSINSDVTVDFWIGKDEETIASGSDVIYLGTNEEKNETATLFLPDDIEPGIYQLKVRASYGPISGESHRTFHLDIGEGIATVEQLLDASLFLEQATIESSDDLTAVIRLENLGSVAADIDMTYSILDREKRIVYLEEESVIVQRETVLRKIFEVAYLPEGKYTFVLEILHDGLSDEFRQDFRIASQDSLLYLEYLVLSVLGVVIALIVIMIATLKKRRKENTLRFGRGGFR